VPSWCARCDPGPPPNAAIAESEVDLAANKNQFGRALAKASIILTLNIKRRGLSP